MEIAYESFCYFKVNINMQGEDIRPLMSENAKLQVIVVENESHKRKVAYESFCYFKVNINKQGQDIRPLMSENAKLQVIVVENDRPKRKVARLKDEVKTCKQAWLEANECLDKIKLKAKGSIERRENGHTKRDRISSYRDHGHGKGRSVNVSRSWPQN